MKRRTEQGLPVIAIVDAFVGALSIVLILSLMASPRKNWENTSPQSDMEIACTHQAAQDWFWFRDKPEDIFPSNELVKNLTSAASPRSLTVRVRLSVHFDKDKCANSAELILTRENALVRDKNEPPIFLLDTVRTGEDLHR